jgi:hypothetical protein
LFVINDLAQLKPSILERVRGEGIVCLLLTGGSAKRKDETILTKNSLTKEGETNET